MSETITFPRIVPDWDEKKTMQAVVWLGKEDVKVEERPRPKITQPGDALIRITSTTLCGSDLHLYHQKTSGMESGDILGHEFMGIIEEVGDEVKQFKKGDKVVASAIICCGNCSYCKQGFTSSCEATNPSKEMEEQYGHRTSGIYGYSHLTGGYPGGQAEYCRVPLADVNLLKVPENMEDEKVLFLSDIVSTGYHATELAKVQEGDTLAVWGAGPIGLMAMAWAKYKGCKKIVAIDCVPERLHLAKEKFGAEGIDFSKKDVVQELQRLIPGGPDCCIDAVGCGSAEGYLEGNTTEKIEAPDAIAQAVYCVRKAGRIGIVGDYFYSNQFPIGAFMEKGLSMSAGQVQVHKYWKNLLEIIEAGKFDPTFLITHTLPLDQAAKAYRMFDLKEDGAIKILLKPRATSGTE